MFYYFPQLNSAGFCNDLKKTHQQIKGGFVGCVPLLFSVACPVYFTLSLLLNKTYTQAHSGLIWLQSVFYVLQTNKNKVEKSLTAGQRWKSADHSTVFNILHIICWFVWIPPLYFELKKITGRYLFHRHKHPSKFQVTLTDGGVTWTVILAKS